MKFFFFVFIICVILLYPLFTHPFYDSHDGEAHVARFAAYYQGFQDGQFPVRWAGNLNFGYGTAVFIFYYPLPGYIASLLHFFGINFQDIFKLLIISCFILSSYTFYLWTRIIFKNKTAVLGGLLYGLAPYHFLNLYVRGDIAELLAFVFVPLVFWSIEKIIIKKGTFFIVMGALFYGLLTPSHNGVSLMFSPIFLLYVIIRSERKKIFFRAINIFILGLLFSAFFWLPALYESKYVNAQLFIGDMYKNHFPTLFQLIYSKWGFGADVKEVGGLSPQIGIIYIIFVIVSCFLWFKARKQKKLLGAWILVFFCSIFIVLPISNVVWKNIEILRLYEFPWRFIGLASFSASVLACFVLEKIKDKKIFIILFLFIFITSLPFIAVKGYISKSDYFYESYLGTTYYHGEASPIWMAGDPDKKAKQQIDIIGGKGVINNLKKKTQEHTFTITAIENVIVLDNTAYFPGWQAMIDGKKIPIQFQDSNHRGLITFNVPKGKHNIKVMFTESPIRRFADILSLLGLLIMVVLFVKELYNNKYMKHL